MLGLMSALSRRERLAVARELDTRTATVLLPFSAVHQRQESLRALQLQAGALPEVVQALHAMMERMEARGQELDRQPPQPEREETTHFSIVDASGMAVSSRNPRSPMPNSRAASGLRGRQAWRQARTRPARASAPR